MTSLAGKEMEERPSKEVEEKPPKYKEPKWNPKYQEPQMLYFVRNPTAEKFPKPLNKNPQAKILKYQDDFPTVEYGFNKKLAYLTEKLGWSELEIGSQQVLERTHGNSATDFFVQTMDGANMAVVMIKEISNSLETNKVPLKRKEIGSICFAPFEETYFRGEIVDIVGQPSVYTVFFSDYGNEAHVSGENLYEMPKMFRKIPRLAINCKWDMAVAKELLKDQEDLVYKARGTMITVKEKITDGQYLVGIGAYIPKSTLVLKEAEAARAWP